MDGIFDLRVKRMVKYESKRLTHKLNNRDLTA